MALDETNMEQEMPEEASPNGQQLSDEEEEDLDIAVMLAQNIIDDGGIEVIKQAMEESNDPGQVIGQFLMQMVSQMSEQLPRDVQLSPRVFLAEGGWVEQISDYLQEQYGVDQNTMDRAEMFIAAQADSMAQGAATQQAAPQQPAMPQQGPAMPQGGML